MRTRSTTLAAGLLALAATGFAPALAPAAPVAVQAEVPGPDDADRWADADEALLHPGVYTNTDGSGCTTNFVFEEFTFDEETGAVVGRDVYLGYAAHCAGTGGSTDTNGCLVGSLPLGTRVDFTNAGGAFGELAYSSWGTMIEVGQAQNSDACRFNDFALIRVDPQFHDLVNPSVPYFGGPTALGGASASGDELFSFGNSSLRFGVETLSPKYELSLGMEGSGWTHRVYAFTPGIPGDSGSGHMNAAGEAMGISSTLALLPFAGSNGVTDLALSLDYMHEHSDLGAELAAGTEPFDTRLP